MSATSELKLTFGYEDDTTRKLNIGPYDPSSTVLDSVKSKIISFNANDVDSVSGVLLSDGGAKFTGIKDAHIVTTEKTVINLND